MASTPKRLRLANRRSRRHRSGLGRRGAPGTAPGSLQIPTDAPASAMRLIAYGADEMLDREVQDVAEIRQVLGQYPVTWVDVVGLGTEAVLRGLAELFGIHRLALEDVVNVGQRSKVEDYGEHHFVVFQTVQLSDHLEIEQISLFIGEGFVVTFQEKPGDSWEPVRERLRRGTGRIRGAGADYLVYALLDAGIDGYFPVVEMLGDRLEALEEHVFSDADIEILGDLHAVRRELLALRRTIWPQRDTIHTLERSSPPFSHETQVYLRDCYDHVLRLVELSENLREMGANLMDLHLSMTSNRMNEVMKVLTIISTIFIPLGFLAGLYGMNFDTHSPWNMPELGWRWGYPVVVGVMVTVVVGLLLYFRSKGWIGGGKR
ncbi:MAG: magnesium/cobalt transporter CorA [Acidobacteria bacterium]|nr:magnesium/cobalt transporter CorA [Acidobacteriota bacterium]